MHSSKELAEELSDMTLVIEAQKENRQEVYNLLLRAMLEIRRLTHRVAVLESK